MKPCRWVGPTAILFFIVGVGVGVLIGILEAAMIWWDPRRSHYLVAPIGPILWLVVPLVDLVPFALLGLCLGVFAQRWVPDSRMAKALLAALGFGMAGWFATYATLSLHHFNSHHWMVFSLLAAFLSFAMALWVITLTSKPCPVRQNVIGNLSRFSYSRKFLRPFPLLTVLLACVLANRIQGSGSDLPPAGSYVPGSHPNIVLIAFDTFAASHSSTNGYTRLTTPNLDSLGRRGIVFENAIAPSSWTLPSFVSMFTGQLPHQHGADFDIPWRGRSPALPEVLRSIGYESAGFNANWIYGGAAQGSGRGFDVYHDGSSTFPPNFRRTLIGRYFESWMYGHADYMGRRNAQEVNREVSQWYYHRSRRPFFLFLNYFDAHFPYYAHAPFKNRFGDVPDDLIGLQASREDPKTRNWRLSPSERAELIEGYDNALAYVDSQVGELLKFLGTSPDWANTFVIVVADHGEAFGEHGRYGHALDLYREVLHVPLIILGPGVPAGVRVSGVVGTREIFATVIDLATHPEAPSQSSLRRFWAPSPSQTDAPEAIISELHSTWFKGERPRTPISLTTDHWHYIQDTPESCELFDWTKDALEQTNLASKPEEQSIIASFQAQLGHQLSETSQPWLGPHYLLAVGSFRLPLLHAMESRALPAEKTTPEDRELLEGLPYH